jgi:hypothetical protein
MSAIPSALIKLGDMNCKQLDVFDMRVTSEPHDQTEAGKTLKGVWNEAWDFRMCGKPVEIEITFIPDTTGRGTSFVINPVKHGENLP